MEFAHGIRTKLRRDPRGTWKSNHRSWWMHRPRCSDSFFLGLDHHLGYLKVKIDGLPIPKGGLVKGPYKPICRDCAIYFSTTVRGELAHGDSCCPLKVVSDRGLHQFLYPTPPTPELPPKKSSLVTSPVKF